jgi:hypothetical protein
MSGELLFIFDRLIICKTVKYINQSDDSSWHAKSRLTADWSVENMNPDMTPNGMLLDNKKNKIKT